MSLRPCVPVGRANNKQTNKVGMMGRDTCPVQRKQTISRTSGTAKYADTTVYHKRTLYFLRSLQGGQLGNAVLETWSSGVCVTAFL